jgi:rare lipoprotein A
MRRVLLVCLAMTLTASCAKRPRVSAPSVSAPVSVATAPDQSRSQTGDAADGRASYYGDPYHGRKTANGETFDKNKMTAAHRSLPFNTWVRVRNQLNGKEVDVRINDRGPFVAGRTIDLSEGAARKVEMIRSGVVPVRMTVIKEAVGGRPNRGDNVFYVVQLGAFRSEKTAQDLRRRFEKKFTGIYVDKPSGGDNLYKVRIGRALLTNARYVERLLRDDNIEAIVVRMQ